MHKERNRKESRAASANDPGGSSLAGAQGNRDDGDPNNRAEKAEEQPTGAPVGGLNESLNEPNDSQTEDHPAEETKKSDPVMDKPEGSIDSKSDTSFVQDQ